MQTSISCILILMSCVLKIYAEKHGGLISTCSNASVTEGETGQLIYVINSAIIDDADPQTFIYIKKYQTPGNILQCSQVNNSSDGKCKVVGDRLHWEGRLIGQQLVLTISKASLNLQGRYDLRVAFKGAFQSTTSCYLTVNENKGVKLDTKESLTITVAAAVVVAVVFVVSTIAILHKLRFTDRLASCINQYLHTAKSVYNGNNSPKDATSARNNSFLTKTDTNTLENNRDKDISPPRVEELRVQLEAVAFARDDIGQKGTEKEDRLTAVQDEQKNADTADVIEVDASQKYTTDEITHTKGGYMPSEGLVAGALRSIVNVIPPLAFWRSERKTSRTPTEDGHFAEEAFCSLPENQDRDVDSGTEKTEKEAFLQRNQTPLPTGSEKGRVQLEAVAFVHDDIGQKGTEKEDSLQKAEGTECPRTTNLLDLPVNGASDTTPIMSPKLRRFSGTAQTPVSANKASESSIGNHQNTIFSPSSGNETNRPGPGLKKQSDPERDRKPRSGLPPSSHTLNCEKPRHYTSGAPGNASSFHSLQHLQKLPHTPSSADETNRWAPALKKQSYSVREREPVSLPRSVPQQQSQKPTYRNWTPHSAGGSGKTPSLHSLQNLQKLPHTPSNADETNRWAPALNKQSDSAREREPVSLPRSVPQQPSQKSTNQSRRPHSAGGSGKTPSPYSLLPLQPAVAFPMVFPVSSV